MQGTARAWFGGNTGLRHCPNHPQRNNEHSAHCCCPATQINPATGGSRAGFDLVIHKIFCTLHFTKPGWTLPGAMLHRLSQRKFYSKTILAR